MSEKCRHSIKKHNNNNSDNPLAFRRTDGGKNPAKIYIFFCKKNVKMIDKIILLFIPVEKGCRIYKNGSVLRKCSFNSSLESIKACKKS